MGVPKFFRWISERYPLINQRCYAPSTHLEDTPTSKDANGKFAKKDGTKKEDNAPTTNSLAKFFRDDPIAQSDVLKSATLAPEIDRLYIDMNGIIHGCSHANNADEDSDANVNSITHEQIFDNVCAYLERVVGDIVQPQELVYMAIDGVAPRAKLNQQRSRRYRSGTGNEIEQTVYDAHLNTLQQKRKEEEMIEEMEKAAARQDNDNDSGGIHSGEFQNNNVFDTAGNGNSNSNSSGGTLLTEVEPGRYAGKFETHLGNKGSTTASNNSDKEDDYSTTTTETSDQTDQQQTANKEEVYKFHSNVITPGTPFFQEFTEHIEAFLKDKLANDPKWKHLTIVFSGSNVPGEGEHKLMDFMRMQQQRPDYSKDLRHCIQGQDGDLIMLGLVTHEPNLCLLREQVTFDAQRRRVCPPSNDGSANTGVEQYVHNPNFEFLHMNVLRDYIAFDFETSNVVAGSPFDLERTIDDFVFMTFFVGNDFLPAMPALDIADEAFDLLWYTYREHRQKWLEQQQKQGKDGVDPYLTHAGNIVSGQRLEDFLAQVGSFESPYYDNKREVEEETNRRIRQADVKFGTETLPSDEILKLKEDEDRAKFREMMLAGKDEDNSTFAPVLSSPEKLETDVFQPSHEHGDDQVDPGLSKRLGNLLKQSVLSSSQAADSNIEGGGTDEELATDIDDQNVKGRYYFDKFQYTPFDRKEHRALRKAYIEGLVWNLKYYFEGCVSWSWYYPYHYGPMISDLKDIDELLDEISFDGRLGEPLRPFEQLMACMPPSQAHYLPEPYQGLMTDPDSEIIDFYPQAFTVDMNGKRWPWEAVVLLPFIDTERLVKHTTQVTNELLSPDEQRRNSVGNAIVMSNNSSSGASTKVSIDDNDKYMIFDAGALQPAVEYGEQTPENKALLFASQLENGQMLVPIPQKDNMGCGQCKHNLEEHQKYCYNHNRTNDLKSQLPSMPNAKGNTNVRIEEFEATQWSHEMGGFQPKVRDGTIVPLPGFPTLRSAPIRSLWRRRMGIDVFGLKSRYKTACLEHSEAMPKLPDLEGLGQALIGSTVWVNYPHLTEAFVTSVSSATHTIRGTDKTPTKWDRQEAANWASRRDSLVTQFEKGQSVTGTGGLIVSPDQDFTLSVRPFEALRDMPNGAKAKSFAKIEIEIPVVVTLWAPPFHADPRLAGVPALLEKNPYKVRSRPDTIQHQRGRNSGQYGGRPHGDDKGPKGGRGKRGSANSKPKRRAKNHSEQSSATLLPPKQPRASLSRQFSTLAPRTNRLLGSNMTNSLRHLEVGNNFGRPFPGGMARRGIATTPALRMRPAARGRGQLVAAGLTAAAAFLFAPGTHAAGAATMNNILNQGIPAPAWVPKPSSGVSALFGIRGGSDSVGSPSNLHQYDAGSNVPPLEFEHGTTTLSFAFEGGAIVAVDSRASLGSFVGSKTVQKVLPINSHMLGTMAGGAADCSYLIRLLRSEAQLFELQHPTNQRISTARVSQILANMLYQNRGLQLSVGTMIVGFDDHGTVMDSGGDAADDATSALSTKKLSGVPKIYYVDNSGVRLEGQLFSAGSGSTFALAILDTEYRSDMSQEEAVSLGIKAIRYATFRDAFSGGFINVYVITQAGGWTKVFTEDVAAMTSLLPSDD